MQLRAKALKIGAVLAVIMTSCSFFVYALPEGESVVSGSASFDRSQADTLAITTASDRLIVDYNSFNIAAQETVRFQQPSAGSIALNRVTGGDPSAIFGTLSANGQIFLVNPNGILFAPGSHVDVAGLVASTMDIDNQDFLAGKYVFSKTGKSGYIVNQGTLSAHGGYVCLLAQGVDNRAAIQADLGTVVLAAGEKVTLALEDANAISVVVDEAVREEVFGPDGTKMSSAVSNSGTIQAAGGKVILTAKVLNKVFDHAINNTGLINVASLVEHEGVIELVAEGAGIVNGKTGVIKADAAVSSVQAGAVLLQADTILQQGLVSANSIERADAGSVTIISESSTILDEASRTEAQAMGLAGNGGQIRINSTRGNTYVNKLAVVDFSAGSLAGNGGTARIDAFKQLGFYGILNGRAPPGFTPGKAILDPEYLYIGNISVAPNTITYADAWRDIIITGPITLANYSTLELHADSLPDGELGAYRPDDVYDPGVGSILNPGDFTISSEYQPGYEGGAYLYMYAGSGIGTLDHPILTNVPEINAIIRENSDGEVFIEQGTMPLYARVYAPHSLVVLTSSGPIYGAAEGIAISADELYLEAVGGIGYQADGYLYPINISVNKLIAVNEGIGSIIIDNDKDLNVLAIVNRAQVGYDVLVSAAGDILVRYGIFCQGDVELEAERDIILNTIADITAYVEGRVVLTAGGRISRRDMETLDYGLLGYWDLGAEGQYFNGIDNYINTGRYFGLGSGDFTMIVWYQGTQTAPYVGLIGATPGMDTGFTLENHNGYARYWLSRELFDSTMPINDGVRHQISMVREGAEGSLYIFDDEMNYAVSFAVPEDSVDSSASFWIGGWGNTRRLAQGNLDDVRVYNEALSGLEIYGQTLLGSGTGTINGLTVVLTAVTGIDAVLGQTSYVTAANGTGPVTINGLGALMVAAATNGGGGDIELSSAADIDVQGLISTTGDVSIEADGDLNVAADIEGDDIYLFADADRDGAGTLSISNAGAPRVFTCYSFNVSGANDFAVRQDGYLSLDGWASYFALETPDESPVRGFGVTSTSEESTVMVESPLTFTDFILLSSAGDLEINADLTAEQLYLYADNNYDGNGQLYSYGQVLLTSKSQFFSTASDFYFEPWEGGTRRVLIPAVVEGYDFSALLGDSDPATEEGLWYFSVVTTPFSGSIYVNAPLTRTAQGQGISLTTGQDLWINAPITTATGGISLEAPYGSIFGGLEYNGETSFTHVTTNVMVNMVAGEIIGSFIIPIRVNVSGESYYGVDLSVYGAQAEELEGPLVSAVLAGTTPSGTVTVNNYPPGQVIFNGAAVWDPGAVVVPEEPGDGEGGSETGHQDGTDLLPDQTGQIIANDPAAFDGAAINQFQVSSPVGLLFGYHPLTDTDASAFDHSSVGPGAYQLVGDELRLIGGPDSLLKFFEQFDQKKKNTSTL